MIRRYFVLHDLKMRLYMQPMLFQSQGQAIRAITDEINRPIQGAEPATTLQAHPEDLELYEIGEYDEETGELRGRAPSLVVKCSELRVRSN